MFLETLQSTFLAVLRIFALSACGYLCVRFKLFGKEGLRRLTIWAVNILLPVFIFQRLVENFTFDQYEHWWIYPLIGAAMMLIGLGVGRILTGFHKDMKAPREFLALLSFQNSANIPLMIILFLFEGKLQQQLTVHIFLYVIAFSLLIWTFGVWLLVRGEGKGIDLKKLFNPPLLATVLTLGFIALGGQRIVPPVVFPPARFFGGFAFPLAMFILGGNLATVELKTVDKKALGLYLLGKMFILPLLAVGAILIFRMDFSLGFLVLIEAAVPSAVTLSLICRYYRVDEHMVNQGLFFSHLLSVITLPVFLTIYMMIAKN